MILNRALIAVTCYGMVLADIAVGFVAWKVPAIWAISPILVIVTMALFARAREDW